MNENNVIFEQNENATVRKVIYIWLWLCVLTDIELKNLLRYATLEHLNANERNMAIIALNNTQTQRTFIVDSQPKSNLSQEISRTMTGTVNRMLSYTTRCLVYSSKQQQFHGDVQTTVRFSFQQYRIQFRIPFFPF